MEPNEEPDEGYIQGNLDAMYCTKCQALTCMECYCDEEEDISSYVYCPECGKHTDGIDIEFLQCNRCGADLH